MYRFVCARRVQTLSELARLRPTHRPQPSPDCLNCKFTTFTCKNIIFLEKFFHPSPKFSSPPSPRPDSLPLLSHLPPPLCLSSGGRRPLLPSPRRPCVCLRVVAALCCPLRRSCSCLRVVAPLCSPPSAALAFVFGWLPPSAAPSAALAFVFGWRPPISRSPGVSPFWRWGKL